MKVGDKITTGGYGSRDPFDFRTVSKVLKNAVVDSKGDKWTLRGDLWGESDRSWSRRFARPFEDKDEERNKQALIEHKERTARAECQTYRWREAPIETVLRVHTIITKGT